MSGSKRQAARHSINLRLTQVDSNKYQEASGAPPGSPMPPPRKGSKRGTEGFEEDEEEEEEPSQVSYETKDGWLTISNASVKDLIVLCTDVRTPDKAFLEVFLATHPYFVQPVKLVDKLFSRLTGQRVKKNAAKAGMKPEDFKRVIQLRILSLVKRWVDTFWEHFSSNETLRKRVRRHLSKMNKSSVKQWVARILKLIDNLASGKFSAYPLPDLSSAPPFQLPKDLPSSPSFMDFPPLEVARQLTVEEFGLFQKVSIDEFYHKAWEKKNKDKDLPLQRLIDATNRHIYWIATEIVSLPTDKKRASAICKFIQVGLFCKGLENWNGVMEVVSALNITSITRLKASWKRVPKKYAESLQELEGDMDRAGNFKNYRQIAASMKPPALPFMGLYLQDLTFIEENPNMTANGLVNFSKMHMLGKLFTSIRKFQSFPYALHAVPAIVKLLRKAEPLTPQQLYEKSKEQEPPADSNRRTTAASSASKSTPSKSVASKAATQTGSKPVSKASGGVRPTTPSGPETVRGAASIIPTFDLPEPASPIPKPEMSLDLSAVNGTEEDDSPRTLTHVDTEDLEGALADLKDLRRMRREASAARKEEDVEDVDELYSQLMAELGGGDADEISDGTRTPKGPMTPNQRRMYRLSTSFDTSKFDLDKLVTRADVEPDLEGIHEDIDEVEEDYHFSVSLSESEEDGADEDLRERLHTGLSGLMLELEGEFGSGEESEAAMFCADCGTAQEPEDMFCQGCGKPVEAPTTPREDQQELGNPQGLLAPSTTPIKAGKAEASEAPRAPAGTILRSDSRHGHRGSQAWSNIVAAPVVDVVRMCTEAAADEHLQQMLLASHSCFLSGRALLAKLLGRYWSSSSTTDLNVEEDILLVRSQVLQLLLLWTREWPDRFILDTDLATGMRSMLGSLLQGVPPQSSLRPLLDSVNALLETSTAEWQQWSQRAEELTADSDPKLSLWEKTSASELAKQMTLMQAACFRAVPVVEWEKTRWKSPGKAPSLQRLIERTNATKYWVPTQVLAGTTVKDRGAILTKWIDVAKRCFKMHNFNTCMAVVTGLNLPSVVRLSGSWEKVSRKDREALAQLQTDMATTGVYARYRDLLRKSRDPVVPFVGLLLDQLESAEGLPSMLQGELVNFAKMMAAGEALCSIRERQRGSTYKFAPVKPVMAWVEGVEVLYDEEMLMQQSKLCEPDDGSGGSGSVRKSKANRRKSVRTKMFMSLRKKKKG